MKILAQIDHFIDRFLTGALVINVIFLLVFSLYAVVARWLSISSIWVDPLVRHLVFLCAFLGAGVATGAKRHIGIDILPRYFEATSRLALKHLVEGVTSFIASFVSFWLAYAGYGLVSIETQYGKMAFLGIHSSVLVAIIPLGFTLIGLRFFLIGLLTFFSKGDQ